MSNDAKQAPLEDAPVLASRDEIWEARYHRNGAIILFAILLVLPAMVYP